MSEHYTAWLVNDTSCLDQPNCDVTILGDDPQYDAGPNGFAVVRGWTSNGEQAFHAITDTDAQDGDVADALSQAKDLMADAGWRVTGDWQVVDCAYIAAVERA